MATRSGCCGCLLLDLLGGRTRPGRASGVVPPGEQLLALRVVEQPQVGDGLDADIGRHLPQEVDVVAQPALDRVRLEQRLCEYWKSTGEVVRRLGEVGLEVERPEPLRPPLDSTTSRPSKSMPGVGVSRVMTVETTVGRLASRGRWSAEASFADAVVLVVEGVVGAALETRQVVGEAAPRA